MLDTTSALLYTFIMAAVIFFCRLFPFIFFAGKKGAESSPLKKQFLSFIEKTAPPVAMTVLAVREIALPIKEAFAVQRLSAEFFFAILPVTAASAVCALLYIFARRNALVSIFGAVILFMVLKKCLR
ncbi:MAG: AzlD domain-containing protein [Spirochaetaceae bacterium]|jgi:branched-subunit amino acid transport protein AzlD|nr:AzlD domain-containing protein [Spirochaetaceae bacterium]